MTRNQEYAIFLFAGKRARYATPFEKCAQTRENFGKARPALIIGYIIMFKRPDGAVLAVIITGTVETVQTELGAEQRSSILTVHTVAAAVVIGASLMFTAFKLAAGDAVLQSWNMALQIYYTVRTYVF